MAMTPVFTGNYIVSLRPLGPPSRAIPGPTLPPKVERGNDAPFTSLGKAGLTYKSASMPDLH